MPPLFKLLNRLYADSDKVSLIETLITGYIENLKKHGAFSEGLSVLTRSALFILCQCARGKRGRERSREVERGRERSREVERDYTDTRADTDTQAHINIRTLSCVLFVRCA